MIGQVESVVTGAANNPSLWAGGSADRYEARSPFSSNQAADQAFLPFPVARQPHVTDAVSPCICTYLGIKCAHNLNEEKAPPVASTTDEAVNPNVIAHAQVSSTSIFAQPRSLRQGCVMEAREAKGLAIAADSKITRQGDVWIVPSQSGTKKYTVSLSADGSDCTCPDFETYRRSCKHIYAVEDTIKREAGEVLPPAPNVVRPTYKQQWTAYNKAQTNEKAKFQELLFDLCQSVDEPPRKGKEGAAGRNRLPLGDMIFCAAFKVYSTVSGRRFISDLAEANRRGFISRTPHFNSIFNYLETEEMTEYLKRLISETSLPLKSVESDFAADSSGFSTGQFVRWFDVKHGGTEDWHDWIKVHLMCGVKTNIVTGVEISGRYANDTTFLEPLLDTTARNGFQMKEVSADKGYDSFNNRRLVLMKGAIPYIPFREPKQGASYSYKGELWRRMYHFYKYNNVEFCRYYHKRSNVETTFSMIKAKFGERLRSKTRTAQINEVLCKVLCHNLCCVIQSMYELGIDADFKAERDNLIG